MDLNKFDFKTFPWLKAIGIALAGLVVLFLGLSIINFGVRSFGLKSVTNSLGVSAPGNSFGYSVTNDSVKSTESGGANLSVRNVAPSPTMPNNNNTTGSDAEAYEVKEYSATVAARNTDNACGTIAGLKPKDYVIFENSNHYDQGCNYRFKVSTANVGEILDIVKALKPKELTENAFTIKQQIEDFTSETDILKNKLATIDQTMKNALSAYDGITALAAQTRDADSLGKAIDSKIKMIERLTQERLDVTAELDRLNRSKSAQLDRLEYTYFNINIYEDKYIDTRLIKDSWKNAVKEFVVNINRIAQDMTVNLALFLFYIVQYLLYLFIIIIVAKYVWRLVRRIWTKEPPKLNK